MRVFRGRLFEAEDEDEEEEEVGDMGRRRKRKRKNLRRELRGYKYKSEVHFNLKAVDKSGPSESISVPRGCLQREPAGRYWHGTY